MSHFFSFSLITYYLGVKMINTDIQKHVEQVLTLIDVVELIQGDSLKGCFLETASWRQLVKNKEYSTVYRLIADFQMDIDSFSPKSDIVQMFDQIKRNLLKAMIDLEHDEQNSLIKVVLSVYNQAGKSTNDFEKIVRSFYYESKTQNLKKIIATLENAPFNGSAMIVTFINLIIISNNRVIGLSNRIKQGED